MVDVRTRYLGIELKNPIIASSSTLTDNVESIVNLEKFGVAAVVLRSIFEEEVALETNYEVEQAVKEGFIDELFDYYDKLVKQKNIEDYLNLISNAKRRVNIPVIASLNCYSNHEWIYYAKKIEEAGADALELNMFLLPSDFSRGCEETERAYLEIINKVLKVIQIPLTLKISYYFTNLGSVIEKLSKTGVKGLVLFNKSFAPDFDIENEKVIPSFILSNPQDISIPLRWISLMSEKVGCDLVASTGVFDGKGVIKQILAGAKAVQIASTIYRNGMDVITDMIKELQGWMNSKGYKSIEDFRGKMSMGKVNDPALVERVQFMKHFGNFK